ncbi:MAG: multidrug ABC transporter ATP-binding protein [Deltaproteobacteria bacterium HGW-Deltaproteobacteria-13]|nr:MAG: multidrug ABC transporter ATP-binding protein [Deltaproteobacteria bacterium HGW-Deltaproteobacteria-13]
MINVVNLTKHFGSNEAVSALSFTINKGEIYGIVGPDGAGKSTLLRLMSTILEPDSGSVLIKDVNIHDHPYAIKENLAYMPQKFGLYEDLTVEENIYFFGRLFGLSKKDIRKKENRLYEFSRLEPFKDRLAGNLSGGMKQKLGLACCLVHSPEIILLDEPTNGVDPVSRREFWKILYDLLAEGVTIVVSTSYLDEAERCNRIAMMYGGRFIAGGTPQEVKNSMKGIFIELATTNPLLSEMLLKEVDEFKGVILTGKSLRLFVDDVQKAKRFIPSILEKHGIGILSIEEKLPSLEDCFVEIVVKGA